MKLLNLGCGKHYHPDWTNVDLVARGPGVIEDDVRQGLRFADETFDGVYHSHVLEHMDPADAEALIAECFRVLKPGGTLRIAVPDLETIARCYLEALDRTERGDELGPHDHDWMTLELLDQMVRTQSGGRMGPYVHRSHLPNREFIRSRMGEELFPTRPSPGATGQTPARGRRWAERWRALRQCVGNARWKAARVAVKWLLGPAGRWALEEGMFRQSGEVHRWMYDRISLRRLLQQQGFTMVTDCGADESRIQRFHDYGLDMVGEQVRKPDSLFMEATKPHPAPDSLSGLHVDSEGQASPAVPWAISQLRHQRVSKRASA